MTSCLAFRCLLHPILVMVHPINLLGDKSWLLVLLGSAAAVAVARN
jgi:hypothetical protein